MNENSTNQGCPCGGCVTCACAAIPKMDEDGLCASCGGQPLLMALLAEEAPHVGAEACGKNDRTAIVAIIADGIGADDLVYWGGKDPRAAPRALRRQILRAIPLVFAAGLVVVAIVNSTTVHHVDDGEDVLRVTLVIPGCAGIFR